MGDVQDDINAHELPSLVHKVHVSHNGSTNSHSSRCANADKDSCCQNAAPCLSSTSSCVSCNANSSDEDEDGPTTVYIRYWGPQERSHASEGDRDSCLVGCFDDAYVHGDG